MWQQKERSRILKQMSVEQDTIWADGELAFHVRMSEK